MDRPQDHPGRSVAEISARVREIQQQVIECLNELEAGINDLGSPARLQLSLQDLRRLITDLWLSNAAVLHLLEEQHKD